MKQILVTILAVLLMTNFLFAQNAYWQQKVDTRIDVRLDDEKHVLHAFIEMDYYNNSPDTLTFIYFHLYPNAYKNDRTAFARQMVENGDTKHYYSKEEDRGYIDSLQFYVNDKRSVLMLTTDIDVVKLMLPEPLVPGNKIKIHSPFRVKIPLTFSRLGHYNQSYQISQWFPKPAVYDKNGWNAFPYLNLGEFYSEFGSYEVSITLPENYIVLATGNIQEASEEAWLDSLAALPIRNDTLKSSTLPSSEKNKTVTFKENNVHDFAWFADKSWVVRKKGIDIPGADRKVMAYSAFYPQHKNAWEASIDDLEIAIQTYSEHVGAYPYKTVKVVEGALSAGGGMEYPTITIIDFLDSRKMVNTVIVHEAGHNWFYGILGSNERNFPWMDESINSFYEKIGVERYNEINPSPTSTRLERMMEDGEKLAYRMLSATRQLQPLNLPSEEYTNMNYGIDIYVKGALYFQWLEACMGADKFKTAMQEYFDTWKFKHPQPEDLRAIFQKHATDDLSWFFEDLMNSSEPVDFAVKSTKRKDDELLVTVKNKTSLKLPVSITVKKSDTSGSAKTISTQPFTGTTTIEFDGFTGYDKIFISKSVPDYNLKNNTQGRRLAWRPLLGSGANKDFKTMNWVAPALGYNYYDGIMPGMLFHNITIPENKFTYALAPMYALGTKQFTGTGFLSYMSYPRNGVVKSIEWKAEGKRFSYRISELNINHKVSAGYTKVAPEVIFSFRNKEFRTPVTRTLSLKGYWINEESLRFNQDPIDSLYRPSRGMTNTNLFAKVRYLHDNLRTFNPFSYEFEGQAGEEFTKLSAAFKIKVDYHQKNKALYLRTYVGKFFRWNNNTIVNNRYYLTATHTGVNDYFYDETYLGRLENSGFLSQQMAVREGGFASRTSMYANTIGLSDNWLLALNVKTDIPYLKFPIPLRIYANITTFSDAKCSNPSGSSVLFESGIETTLFNMLNVYIPVIVSKDFSDYNNSVYSPNKFLKTISFSLQLSDIKWRRSVGNFL